MNLSGIKYFYFIGIGGIGMSALARYFKAMGKEVSGYDKTPSELTGELEREGMPVHFGENITAIPQNFRDEKNRDAVLVVYTPAVPADHAELVFFREHGYTVVKRAEVLGFISRHADTVAVAGTHGKTTTTTLTAHLLRTAGINSTAFLGGISQNYNTNLLLAENPLEKNTVVAEADEYDRSFLWLHPHVAVVTSVDADHLDIYGNKNELLDTYRTFIGQVKKDGMLVTKNAVLDQLGMKKEKHVVTYSLEDRTTDAHTENIRVEQGYFAFDYVLKGNSIKNLRLGLPGRHNVENAVAAVSAAKFVGVHDDAVREALQSFRGVKRRFDFRIRSEKIVFIDDYAHHPEELKTCITSVRELFPGKRIAGIFQPHLFSRTRDFADGFARSLELLDDIILLEIYPAREKPVAGVDSNMLLEKIKSSSKQVVAKTGLIEKISAMNFDVLLTLGAGDIDRLVEPVEDALRKKFNLKTGEA